MTSRLSTLMRQEYLDRWESCERRMNALMADPNISDEVKETVRVVGGDYCSFLDYEHYQRQLDNGYFYCFCKFVT